MKNRRALGMDTAVVAASGFGVATASAQPGPAAAGTDVESMISHCTQQLSDDQRSPAAESMRPMMAEDMTGAAMDPGTMGQG